MKKTGILLYFFLLSFSTNAQIEPVVVTEQTMKLSSEKELYYGFAAGDEIIFDLQVVKGKHLKEVEIIEYPHSSKLFEFKTKKVSEKKIKVNKTGIYKFRVKGGGIGTRICRTRILRIPASDHTVAFDTSIDWKIRLDSTYITKYTKELVQVDTAVINITDRTERVHSKTNLNSSNVSKFNLSLPINQVLDLETSEVISWGYWLGVGNEGKAAFAKTKKKFLASNVSTVAAINPMAGLALGTYTAFVNAPSGDNINYQISGYTNGVFTNLAQGNSVASSGRVTSHKQGSFTVTLQNDNLMEGIDVNMKVTAIVVTKKYINKSYKELQVKKFRYPVLRN